MIDKDTHTRKKKREEGRGWGKEQSGEELAGARNSKDRGPEMQTWLGHAAVLISVILPSKLLSSVSLGLAISHQKGGWGVGRRAGGVQGPCCCLPKRPGPYILAP